MGRKELLGKTSFPCFLIPGQIFSCSVLLRAKAYLFLGAALFYPLIFTLHVSVYDEYYSCFLIRNPSELGSPT